MRLFNSIHIYNILYMTFYSLLGVSSSKLEELHKTLTSMLTFYSLLGVSNYVDITFTAGATRQRTFYSLLGVSWSTVMVTLK